MNRALIGAIAIAFVSCSDNDILDKIADIGESDSPTTTGAYGDIDFWGNCWEWTCSFTAEGLYIIKGGSWDSSRDDCRSEKSDVLRSPTIGYDNLGMRIVRTDRDEALAGLR